jgi:hypothetical protein
MSNYTMQCKRCHVHTDYSSKTDLCDACEIKLLRSRLTIAEEALKAIWEHEHCDADNVYGTFPPGGRASYAKGHRCCATIAREGLKRMEEVK